MSSLTYAVSGSQVKLGLPNAKYADLAKPNCADLHETHYTGPHKPFREDLRYSTANFTLLVSAKNMINTAPARKNADVSPSAEPIPTLGNVAT